MALNNNVFSQSIAQAFERSPAQARLIGGLPSLYSVVSAVVPVCGWGTINSSSTYGAIVFDDVWPAIYMQFQEVWTQTDGGAQTKTTTTDKYYWDLTPQVVTTGPGGVDVGTITGISVSPSVFSATYNCANYATTLATGTYSATISMPFLPTLGLGDSWASRTAACLSFLAGITVPSLGSVSQSFMYNPISTSPGYSSEGGSGFSDSGIILAAAVGLACRNNGGSGGTTVESGAPASLCILDSPTSIITAGGVLVPNNGAIMCSKSIWSLNGRAPKYPVGITGIGINHRSIFGQVQTVNTSSTNLSSVIVPASFAVGSQLTANGTTYPNPVSPLPQIVTFNPGDVTSNLSGSPAYGVLGFNSVAN